MPASLLPKPTVMVVGSAPAKVAKAPAGRLESVMSTVALPSGMLAAL